MSGFTSRDPHVDPARMVLIATFWGTLGFLVLFEFYAATPAALVAFAVASIVVRLAEDAERAPPSTGVK
jgi:hypothetical protein